MQEVFALIFLNILFISAGIGANLSALNADIVWLQHLIGVCVILVALIPLNIIMINDIIDQQKRGKK